MLWMDMRSFTNIDIFILLIDHLYFLFYSLCIILQYRPDLVVIVDGVWIGE
jgi:hypothetical protein